MIDRIHVLLNIDSGICLIIGAVTALAHSLANVLGIRKSLAMRSRWTPDPRGGRQAQGEAIIGVPRHG
jgi:hypothetical protein